jgi:hypothetical protein
VVITHRGQGPVTANRTWSPIRTVRPIRAFSTKSPDRLADALTETINEITEKRLGPRRNRTCPRVVKRYRAHSHRIKRATDRIQLHRDPPKIHIFKIEGLT